MTGSGVGPTELERHLDASSASRSRVLLGTDRKWLVSALKEVLTPEGFDLVAAGDPEQLLEKAVRASPALVLVDEELDGLEVEELAHDLVERPLGAETPLLLYTSSSAARTETHTRALEAGFWDLLADPLRPALLVARIRRLLRISERMVGGDSRPSTGSSVRFLTLEELGRILPAIGALAEREEATVSIVMLGPTSADDDRASKKAATASLCGPNLRRADLCALGDDAEIAIVAFDTSAEEAESLVHRLDELAASQSELDTRGERLSASIVELEPSPDLQRVVDEVGRTGEGETVSLDRVVRLFHLEDARDALRDVREAGGGIRVVDLD